MAFASLVIDDVLEVHGFRLINGAKGLFVSPPQHKGKGKDEAGNEVDRWYDDVRFVGEASETVAEEIKKSIIDSYNSKVGGSQKVTAASAQAQVNAASSNTQSQNARKPLW